MAILRFGLSNSGVSTPTAESCHQMWLVTRLYDDVQNLSMIVSDGGNEDREFGADGHVDRGALRQNVVKAWICSSVTSGNDRGGGISQ